MNIMANEAGRTSGDFGVDILQLILRGWHTCQCCFSLWLLFGSFIGLLLLIFFWVGVSERKEKKMRGRMSPAIASGTPVTVWELLLIKQVLLFKVRVIRGCNTQLGKQTDINSADKHMLRMSERRRLNRMSYECKHAEQLRVRAHTCVSMHVHHERPATATGKGNAAKVLLRMLFD